MPDRDGAMTMSEIADAWDKDRERIAELEAMNSVQECFCQQKYYPRIRGDKCPHCEINRRGRKIVELEAELRGKDTKIETLRAALNQQEQSDE